MLTISRVSSVEYYLDCAAEERDRTAYYTDAADEPPGRWHSPRGWLANDQSIVKPADLRQVAAGFASDGGKRLVQSNTKSRRAAYDLTFSAPKSVSALWAVSAEEKRKTIEEAHSDAVRKALAKIQELGLIETRRGKGSKVRERPEDLLAAIYDHHSTRAGDPQLHSHVLLMNICLRQDGTTGSIDNAKLMPLLKAVGAFYRSTLAKNLQANGLTIEQQADGFSIAGVPEALTEQWSKRTAAIKEAAEKEGYTIGEDREFEKQLTLKTRQKKGQLPSRAEMEQTWRAELSELNLTGERIWAEALTKTEDEQEPRPAGLEASACITEAVAELFSTESVIESRKILELALIKSQGRCPPDLIWPAMEEAEKDGLIVRLNPDEKDGSPIYSTPAIIEAERTIIEIGQRRKDERLFVAPHIIDRAIRQTNRGSFQLTAEQTEAVKHALGRAGVSIIDGKAGVGKSTVFKTIHDAAAEAGLDTHLIAPSWKATTGTAKDLKRLKAEQARALAGFLNKLENGQIKLSRKSLILVDEAGMISTKDMQRLLALTDRAGAKVVLAGDSQQLAAVAAGDPLSLLIQRIGAAKIARIIRQKEQWMAEASEKFASGNAKQIKEAINEYAMRGHFSLADNRDEAMDDLAEAWLHSTQAGEEVGVLAARNSDVSELNARIRQKAEKADLISGPAVEIQAVGRGKNAKAGPLTIQAGDRLLLGEGLRLGGRSVDNNSALTVVSVSPGPPAKMTIRLEDGTVLTVAAAELTGPKGRPIRLQHGFAGTVYSAQGATFDRTLLFDGGNLRSRAAYVAMTRHRQNVQVFVNAEAIQTKHAGRPADRRLTAGAGGVAGFADEDQEDFLVGEEVLGEDEVLSILATTWSAADRKANALDYLSQPEPEADEEEETDDEDQEDLPMPQKQFRRQKPAPRPSGPAPG